jgi:hypothetical protein
VAAEVARALQRRGWTGSLPGAVLAVRHDRLHGNRPGCASPGWLTSPRTAQSRRPHQDGPVSCAGLVSPRRVCRAGTPCMPPSRRPPPSPWS